MKKALIITAAITSVLMSGCASQPVSTFESFHPQDLNSLVSSGYYIQKADNFFVINDSSSSMAENYLGTGYPAQPSPTKLSVEKEILNRINLTIPDLKLTSSIRSFGFGPCLDWKFTRLNMPPILHSKAPFGSGIDTLTCASGGTPMDSGIEETTEDLSATTGNIAVLILSDGGVDNDPVPAVKSLRQRYGDKLCVYTVWVGNEQDKYGQNQLSRLSDFGGCGFGTTAERISSTDGMTKFVQSIFLKAGTPPVADCSTQDDDADGVNNCNDKCLNTLKGAHVNAFGCWIVDIKFDNDKSNIKPQYYRELDNAVTVIQQNPGVNIEVQGHTSSTGTVNYNQRLSERRALAVKNYLHRNIQNGGTLTARGYGLTQPIDTNETEEGRSNNRRVQLEVLK
ncbi:MAG: OmpA family protein [Methylobacter sp.]|uniref:OmpA family protein n=1 Tax=Methylobacter sp. TaxID=2051955 RepID=UPI00272FD1A3|nr:OmpA family protein [Methylobacter sp.]MDP1665213.1 OmpA family protein [Methylobacter sp.]MDP1969459.1 OmpA family protein [Methylobacter sp.]